MSEKLRRRKHGIKGSLRICPPSCRLLPLQATVDLEDVTKMSSVDWPRYVDEEIGVADGTGRKSKEDESFMIL